MRIIAGTHRRRKLLTPADDKVTRPLTDRVKQSLFDRLAATGIFEPDESNGSNESDDLNTTSSDPRRTESSPDVQPVGLGLDLFAGVGSFGLEALSRGIARFVFVERNRKICDLLQKNIANLDLEDRSDVMNLDVLGAGWSGLLPPQQIRLILCDPPYDLTRDESGMARIRKLLEDLAPKAEAGGVAVLRTDGKTEAPTLAGWHKPLTLHYGSMATHLYARPDDNSQ